MLHDLTAYYNAVTLDLSVGVTSSEFKKSTAACLQKTYIIMHPTLETDACLEIGAHEADFSLKMAKTYGKTISVCAIEASPRTHTYFSNKINFKDFGVSYINAVVSDREEETLFYEHVDNKRQAAHWVSSLHKDIRNWKTRIDRIHMKSVRGDTLIENKFRNKKKIAVWIDVEGCQYEVLNSLSKSFELGIINSVFIEVEKKEYWENQKMLADDIIIFMKNYNFSPFLRDYESDNQYNIIFVHNSVTGCDFSLFFEHYRGLLRSLGQDAPFCGR